MHFKDKFDTTNLFFLVCILTLVLQEKNNDKYKNKKINIPFVFLLIFFEISFENKMVMKLLVLKTGNIVFKTNNM